MKVEEYLKAKKQTSSVKNYGNSLIKRTLLTCVVVLIILIISNLKSSWKDFLNKYIFETNYNFAKINSIYKKYLLNIKPKNDKTKVVSSNELLEYTQTKKKDNGVVLTINDNYNVKMLESGLVVFIGEKDGYKNAIVVQQSNGIDVVYGNVITSDIKVYDYIEKGKIIGTASKELYLSFSKEGEVLDYKTYIK